MPSPTNRIRKIIDGLITEGVEVRRTGPHYVCKFPNSKSVTISVTPGKGVDLAIRKIQQDIKKAWQ